VRAKSVTHVDRTVGSKAMEAMETSARVKAATAHMKAAAAHMEAAAAHMEAAASATKMKAAFGHCRNVGDEAERTHRNAGR